jgi:prevent-host-death family protein
MSESLGVFDAKSQFSQLVDRAERGEEIVITRHGRPVAKLGPVAPGVDDETRERLLVQARELREAIRARSGDFTVEEILAYRDEGRR